MSDVSAASNPSSPIRVQNELVEKSVTARLGPTLFTHDVSAASNRSSPIRVQNELVDKSVTARLGPTLFTHDVSAASNRTGLGLRSQRTLALESSSERIGRAAFPGTVASGRG